MDRIAKFKIGDRIIYCPISNINLSVKGIGRFPDQDKWKKGIITELGAPHPIRAQAYRVDTEFGTDILKHDDTGLEYDRDENDIEWYK